MKRLLFICALFILTVTTMADETNVEEILRDGANKFTTKMFDEIVKSKPVESVVLSAFSVMAPIAQLALASVGESHDELLGVIGMPNDNVTKAAFSSVNTQLRTTKGITLKTASKIYVSSNYEINPEFSLVTRDTFGSEIQSINFAENQKAANEINSWVENETNHKIKDLISPDTLTSDSKALLVNAIYFKGKWAEPFNELGTYSRDFHVSKDKVIQLRTMFQTGDYKYVENYELKFQILEIPYEGDEASFVIVLPREIDGINELEERLKDPTFLDKEMSNLETTDVVLYIPKFKIETTTNLKDVLTKMGVSKMFDSTKARLDYLLKDTDNLYIDSAIQKAFIEINEEGAEAAAANVFEVNYLSAPVFLKPPPVLFRADRPFYYGIKTKSLTLFNGVFRGE